MILLVIWWLLIGLAVGALARLLVPGRDPLGCFGTALLGIAGSFVGGFLFALIAFHKAELRPSGLIGSVIGAMLLLVLRRLLVRNG
jgi:uncharacterized membrane protein YeaQ/YmgE (transglycosylase-associated protein family)